MPLVRASARPAQRMLAWPSVRPAQRLLAWASAQSAVTPAHWALVWASAGYPIRQFLEVLSGPQVNRQLEILRRVLAALPAREKFVAPVFAAPAAPARLQKGLLQGQKAPLRQRLSHRRTVGVHVAMSIDSTYALLLCKYSKVFFAVPLGHLSSERASSAITIEQQRLTIFGIRFLIRRTKKSIEKPIRLS